MSTSITEIGNSSTANESGDLVLDIEAMLESSKQQNSIGGLISVPDHLRKQDEQAFTPLLISIGPIHHSNAKLQTMKGCKVQFCERFIKRAKIDLKDLVKTIRGREKEIRSYYAETILSNISNDDFVTMILVDGMFIFEYFWRQSESDIEKDDLTIPKWMGPILQSDLVLLENQLPFFVLEMMFIKANFPRESKIRIISLRELAFDFFKGYNFQGTTFNEISLNIEHFTDLVRFFYLREGYQQPYIRFRGPKLSYSATHLHEAGVKFKGVECYRGNGVFPIISFDLNNGELEMPIITLSDERIRLIRNIIALEQSKYVGEAYVTDYFVILDFLIDNSKDVDLLCDKKILVNYLGDSNAAASAINNLNPNISWNYMNYNYSEISRDLNEFYEKPWNKWKATLWRQYFSTPWRVASTSAAIILLLLTAIQTICSLKSTEW